MDANMVSASDEEDKSNSQGSNRWDQLPKEFLLKIFGYLEQNDLLRAATVCQSWRDLINTTPEFWRSMHLKLSCKRKSFHNRQARWYAQQQGSHFRDVTVSCLHQHKNLGCKATAHNLQKVLMSLQHATLTSLQITDLQLQGALRRNKIGIARIMMRFLSGQRRLQRFRMTSSHWPVHFGRRVFNSVWNGVKGTLKSLDVDGFFEPTPWAKRQDIFQDFLGRIILIKRLTKLGIDYTQLSDLFLKTIAKTHAGKLTRLKITARKIDLDTPVLSKSAWLALVRQ